jgi:uncharacterized membrane protein HdeD (DUF308 family)
MTFFWPDLTAVVLLYFIAAWALFSGVMEIIAAVRIRRMIENEWVMILNGILSVLFGLVLFVLPEAGALSPIGLIGIFAIIIGILLLILGFRLRKMARDTKMAA